MLNFSSVPARLSALILSAAATVLLPAKANAAIELVEAFDDYQVTRVVSSKVCFAVYNGKSKKDKKITYATFKTKSGDRWQVARFIDNEGIKAKGDLLAIRFDDDHMIARGAEFSSKGDFALPFVDEKDLKAFDDFVGSKEVLELSLKNLDDSITIKLDGLRKARAALDTCLENLDKPVKAKAKEEG